MDKLPKELKDVSVIRENQRYTTFAATYDNDKVFVKLASSPKLVRKIRAELWGIEAFYQISQLADLPFAVPRVRLCGENYLAMSWAPGEPINLTPENASKYNKIFVSSLVSIDRATRLASPLPTRWTKPDATGESAMQRLFKRLSKHDYTQFLDKELVESTKAFVKENAEGLEARLSHADFTPNNLLQTETGHLTLVDYEAVQLSWPRFYDIVNLAYNRIILHPELTDAMHQLLSDYFKELKTDPQQQHKQLNTIAMFRTLSLIFECLSEPNDYHNTKAELDPAIAERLQLAMQNVAQGKLFAKFS